MGQVNSNIIPLHVDADNPKGLYKFTLPEIPRETEIWYHNVAKNDQLWKTPANKDFRWLDQKGELKNVKQMSERDRILYIEYWRDKIENGLWIMINGEPTWLTGLHVEHLIFNKFKSQNFIFLQAQKERFYFRKLTEDDILCDGRCYPKGRRVGITAEEISAAIRVLNDDFANNVSCQSDTYEKARSTLLSKINPLNG